MNKLLVTACVISFIAVGCTHKPSGSSNSGYSGDDINSISKSTFEDLENKVGDRVFFAVNSSSLSDVAKEVLKRQIEFMKKHSHLKFVLEGYCDKRGTVEYNLALGERRANSVKEFLASHGLNSDRLTVISFGKERPAVMGDSQEAYRQNRRVVTVIR
ncbi:MAG: peptidoglycan-associated lipoprotein [Candidatus Midichloriaceae bacterium]|jgi:peptidoglycan-associated lipoprotein